MRRWRRRDWFRVQVVAAFAICGAAIAFAAPNLARSTTSWPSWLPHNQVPLGVDLVGGTAPFLEPDWREIHAALLGSLRLRIRIALDQEQIRYEDLRVVGGAVRLRLIDRLALDRLRKIALDAGKALDLSPTSWMPGIQLHEQAGQTLSVSLNAIGRAAFHDRFMRLTRRRLESELACLGVPDYRVEREGDRIKVLIRGLADIPHSGAAFRPC